MATGGDIPELDPDVDPPAKGEHLAEFLWSSHAKVTEHLKKEYDLDLPTNRRICKDLKYHADQCAILTNLAKQRDEKGPPEFWPPQARNSWVDTAWEAWETTSSDLYSRLENPKPLVEELTKLQVILEIWAKIDPAPSPARPIPERVSTSEQISISTQPSQALTRSRTSTVRLMYDTGARPKASETPYLTDDLRRLFRSSEDRTGVSRPETEVSFLSFFLSSTRHTAGCVMGCGSRSRVRVRPTGKRPLPEPRRHPPLPFPVGGDDAEAEESVAHGEARGRAIKRKCYPSFYTLPWSCPSKFMEMSSMTLNKGRFHDFLLLPVYFSFLPKCYRATLHSLLSCMSCTWAWLRTLRRP